MNRVLTVGLVLLLVALGLALFLLYRVEARLNSVEKQLEEIKEHQPIRYVGTFPENIHPITQMIKETQVKLLIVGDFCAYGHYSKPEEYQEYRAVLQQLGNHVDMYVYNKEAGERATISQFTEDFNSIKARPEFDHYFKEVYPNDPQRPVPKDLKHFKEFMNGEQERCIKDLSAAGVRVHQTITEALPLFIWIRDGDRAIFSAYNLGDEAREVSLETSDRTLLNLLQEIYTQALKRSVKTPPDKS